MISLWPVAIVGWSDGVARCRRVKHLSIPRPRHLSPFYALTSRHLARPPARALRDVYVKSRIDEARRRRLFGVGHLNNWLVPDWRAMFVPQHSILEVALRGTITYFTIIVLFRVVLKRQAGSLGVGDALLVVLIADASQNAMAGEYSSITEGMILVATLLFLNFVVDWATYRYKAIRELLEPAPRLIVQGGQIQHQNLAKEMISLEDLAYLLRRHGFDQLTSISEVRVESGGDVTVVPTASSSPPRAAQGL